MSKRDTLKLRGRGRGKGGSHWQCRSPGPNGSICGTPTLDPLAGVLGKGGSGRKHNPYSALVKSTAKSTTAKKWPTPDYEALQPGSGKSPQKTLPIKQPKNPPPAGSIKRSHKFCPGTVALSEIRRFI